MAEERHELYYPLERVVASLGIDPVTPKTPISRVSVGGGVKIEIDRN
jgi:hypothetical protein